MVMTPNEQANALVLSQLLSDNPGNAYDPRGRTNARRDQGKLGYRRGMGSMNFPGVKDTYQTDPLTGIAQNMLETGQSTAPVASGGWGWAEGLARLGQGAIGGKWAGDQRERYQELAQQRAQDFETRYKAAQAAQAAQQAQAAQSQPPPAAVQVAAQALTTGQVPQAPQAPQQGAGFVPSPLVANPTQPPVSSRGLSTVASGSPVATNRAQRRANSASNFNSIYDGLIAPNEGGFNARDPNTGRPVNFGIDQKANPDIDVSKLNPAAAKKLMFDRYWRPSGADSVPENLRAMYFDTYVMNPSKAKEFLAKSNGDPAAFMGMRRQFLSSIKGPHEGWENRNQKVEQYAGLTPGGDGTPQGSTVSNPSIPDVPAPMDMPSEPDIPQSKPSARRILAESLMGSDAMFPLMQQNLDAGMQEEADLNKQREENVAQLKSLTHQSRMQAWQGQVNAAYEAKVAERGAAIKQGYDLDLQRLKNEGDLATTMATNAAKANKLRPLGVNSTNKLKAGSDQLQNLLQLSDGFDDNFFGKGASVLGDLQNKAYETLGIGDQKQVDWWKNYNMMDNIVKHDLYGSNFTDGERRDWDKATITTATNAQQARMNLERRIQIVHAALMRQANSDAHVYDNEQIGDLIDLPGISQRMQSRKPLYTPPAPTANNQPQGGGNAAPAGRGNQGGKAGLPYGATDHINDGGKDYYLVNGRWMEEDNSGSRTNRPAGTPRKAVARPAPRAAPPVQWPTGPVVNPYMRRQ